MGTWRTDPTPIDLGGGLSGSYRGETSYDRQTASVQGVIDANLGQGPVRIGVSGGGPYMAEAVGTDRLKITPFWTIELTVPGSFVPTMETVFTPFTYEVVDPNTLRDVTSGEVLRRAGAR